MIKKLRLLLKMNLKIQKNLIKKLKLLLNLSQKVLKKNDQKIYKDELKNSKKDDQNNQNPFIAINWHK
jgi:hypothetical protein